MVKSSVWIKVTMDKGLLMLHKSLLNMKFFLCRYIRQHRVMILSNFHAFISVFESLGIRNVPLVWVEIVFIKQL